MALYNSITYDSGLFHNGVSTGVDMELLAPGDMINNISSIMMTNTHATTDCTVSLFIQNNPTGAAASTFYILSTVAIPSDTSLLLDTIPAFDNSTEGYGLYMSIASAGGENLLDVLINI